MVSPVQVHRLDRHSIHVLPSIGLYDGVLASSQLLSQLGSDPGFSVTRVSPFTAQLSPEASMYGASFEMAYSSPWYDSEAGPGRMNGVDDVSG